MKINCYIALVAAALGCACNPLADTDDMDNNVQATRIAFSPEVVTLDNAGRNAEEDQGQNVIVTLNPKARRSMAWSAETDKTETWCTLTECSVTDARRRHAPRIPGSPRPKIRPTNARRPLP